MNDHRRRTKIGRRIENLLRFGLRHYHSSRNGAAVDCFVTMASLAKSIGDEASLLEARFWQGSSLHGAGNHEEALLVLSSALEETSLKIDAPEFYRVITRALRVMIEIPFPLADIESALRTVEQQMEDAGIPDRKSRIALVRSRLLISRGLFPEALKVGIESLDLARNEAFACSLCSHYWPITQLCTWLGHLDLARAYLDEWKTLAGPNPNMIATFVNARESDLARCEGRAEDAVAFAKRSFELSKKSEEYPERFTATYTLLRAYLFAGDTDAASDLMELLQQWRRSEMTEHAYLVQILLGDFYLARSRRHANLSVVDPELGVEHTPVSGTRDIASARSDLERARNAYADARVDGDELDELLESSVHAWDQSIRSALIERTKAEIGGPS